MTTFRDNGFELPIEPPRIDFARNSYVYQHDPKIMPKKSAIDYLIDAFKAPFKPQPKRKPIVKLRKERQGVFEGFWKWKCRQCSNTWGTSGIWEYAINAAHTHAIMKHALPGYLADRHARNHHGK